VSAVALLKALSLPKGPRRELVEGKLRMRKPSQLPQNAWLGVLSFQAEAVLEAL